MMRDSQMIPVSKLDKPQEVEDASSMCESEMPPFAQGMEMFTQLKQLTNRSNPGKMSFSNGQKQEQQSQHSFRNILRQSSPTNSGKQVGFAEARPALNSNQLAMQKLSSMQQQIETQKMCSSAATSIKNFEQRPAEAKQMSFALRKSEVVEQSMVDSVTGNNDSMQCKEQVNLSSETALFNASKPKDSFTFVQEKPSFAGAEPSKREEPKSILHGFDDEHSMMKGYNNSNYFWPNNNSNLGFGKFNQSPNQGYGFLDGNNSNIAPFGMSAVSQMMFSQRNQQNPTYNSGGK